MLEFLFLITQFTIYFFFFLEVIYYVNYSRLFKNMSDIRVPYSREIQMC